MRVPAAGEVIRRISLIIASGAATGGSQQWTVVGWERRNDAAGAQGQRPKTREQRPEASGHATTPGVYIAACRRCRRETGTLFAPAGGDCCFRRGPTTLGLGPEDGVVGVWAWEACVMERAVPRVWSHQWWRRMASQPAQR